MRVLVSSLMLHVLIVPTAHCEEISAPKAPSIFSDSLITAGEDVYRSGGICAFRKDSPAFHFEPAEQGTAFLTLGEFNSSIMGGFSIIQRGQQPIPEGSQVIVRGGYGSFETAQASALASFGTKTASIMGGYGYRRANVAGIGGGGLKSDILPATSTVRYRTETRNGLAYESHAGYLRINATPLDPLTLSASWLRLESENVRYPMLKLDGDYDIGDSVEASARIKKPLPGVRDITVGGFWRYTDTLMDDRLRESARLPNGSLRPFATQNSGKTSHYGARISATIPVANGEAVAGGDYSMRYADSASRTSNGTLITERSIIPDVAMESKGVYLTWEGHPVNGFRFFSGVRGDFISVNSRKAPASPGSEQAEPTGWLKIGWQATKELFMSLAFGSAVRFPSPHELYIGVISQSSQLGVPGLSPARSYRPELTVDYIQEPMAVHGYAFWSHIDDFVAIYQMTPTTKSYRNVEAQLWGAGASATAKLTADLNLNLALDYSHGTDLTWSRPLPEVAPLIGSASFGYDNSRLFASLTERFSSRQWRYDRDVGEQPNPSWAVTDLKAGYRFKGVTVSSGIDNLADSRYSTNLLHLRDPLFAGVRVPEAGRFVWALIEVVL